MVPGAGVEPAQCFHRGILSPLRLPISPPGHYEGGLFLSNQFTIIAAFNYRLPQLHSSFEVAFNRNIARLLP
jgi:hypothetical protein